jgi:hypothetical protein
MIAIPLSWKIAIGAALTTIVLGAMWWAFSEGKGAALTETLEKTIATQRSITDADARGPRTPDDVDRRLRDGSF